MINLMPGRLFTSRLLPLGLTLAALILLGVATHEIWLNILQGGTEVNWHWLAVALALSVFYRIANAITFTPVVAALGYHLSIAKTIGVWLGSELLRWLPGGGVWSYLSRLQLLVRAGVPQVVGAAAVPLELLLTLAAWTTLGFGGAVLLNLIPIWSASFGGVDRLFGIILACGLVLGIGVYYVWSRLLDRLWVPLTQVKPVPFQAFAAYLAYTALNALRGVGLYFVVLAVTISELPPLGVIISANAIAWVLGFIAVFAPGGIGVRELGIATLLMHWLPFEEGLFIALVWRGVQLVEELVLLPALWCIRLNPRET